MLDIEDIGCLANSDLSSYLIETLFEPVTNKSYELILDWKHANDEALQNYFNSQNWALLFHNQTVSQCWDTLVNVVNEGISEFVPRVRRRRRGRPPWLTRSALRQCRKKTTILESLHGKPHRRTFYKIQVAGKNHKESCSSRQALL